MAEGFDGYLSKPVDMQALAKELRRVMVGRALQDCNLTSAVLT
jgi:DNA-binding NarL/FixJ family response regulator